MDENWVLCRDRETKYWYFVKETRQDDKFELVFSFFPDYEKGWQHGGVRFVAKTLKGFLDSIYYKKYQDEKITNENILLLG